MRIAAKIAGQRRGLFSPYELEWPVAKQLTIRQLLDTVVREEVAAFLTRNRERQLDRVMTPAQITAASAKGRVDPAGKLQPADVDVDEAIATALEAFEDGLYFVFVDGRQVAALDESVRVVPTSELMFVRLSQLAGG